MCKTLFCYLLNIKFFKSISQTMIINDHTFLSPEIKKDDVVPTAITTQTNEEAVVPTAITTQTNEDDGGVDFQLNSERAEIVRLVWERPPTDDKLSKNVAVQSTIKDLHTLKDRTWVCDNIITDYLRLVKCWYNNQRRLKAASMPTSFYPTVEKRGCKDVMDLWFKKSSLFENGILLIPLFSRN